jgi:ribonuclease HI
VSAPPCGPVGKAYLDALSETAPQVVVDASYQDGWGGAGLVLGSPRRGIETRAHVFRVKTSLDAERHGIRLALEWLEEVGLGRGVVYCDCQGAVKAMYHTVPDVLRLAHDIRYLAKEERMDGRHLRAHQISVVAREMGQRLASTDGRLHLGPLPVPVTISKSPDASPVPPPGKMAKKTVEPQPAQWPRASVVIDNVPNLHAFARVLADIPAHQISTIHGQTLFGGQAMFGVRLTVDAARALADHFDRQGLRATIYLSEPGK